MNENFISAFKKLNITQYQLSHETGIPFATINGILLQTHDINRCNAATLIKLSNYMNTDIQDIINPFPIMDRVEGKYHGIHYIWETGSDGTMNLHLLGKNKNIILPTGCTCMVYSRRHIYAIIADMIIDAYLQDQESEQFINELSRT